MPSAVINAATLASQNDGEMTRLLTSFLAKVKQSVSVLESEPTMALSMQFSADDEAFREEVRDFLNTHLSPALRDAAARQTTVFPEREVALQWQRVLQEAKGWAAPAWPKAFGGPGFSANQRYIFNQECARAGAPGLIP